MRGSNKFTKRKRRRDIRMLGKVSLRPCQAHRGKNATSREKAVSRKENKRGKGRSPREKRKRLSPSRAGPVSGPGWARTM